MQNSLVLAILAEKAVKRIEHTIDAVSVTLPHLLYHYELEYPALINPASTGMPVENFSLSCLINSSGVR
jgi:hypothetical protein